VTYDGQSNLHLDDVVRKIKGMRVLFPNVLAVYLFGSRVKGTQHAKSDLDVALVVKPDDPQDFDGEYQIIAEDWRHELRHHVPPEVVIDVWPINFDEPSQFADTAKYVEECSISVYDHQTAE
jgi:hypothetical protein